MSKCLLRRFNKLSKSYCFKNTYSRFAKGEWIQAPKDLDWIWNSELVNYDHVKIKPVSTQYPSSPKESQNTRSLARCCITSNAWQSVHETSGWFTDFFSVSSDVCCYGVKDVGSSCQSWHTTRSLFSKSLYVHLWIDLCRNVSPPPEARLEALLGHSPQMPFVPRQLGVPQTSCSEWETNADGLQVSSLSSAQLTGDTELWERKKPGG